MSSGGKLVRMLSAEIARYERALLAEPGPTERADLHINAALTRARLAGAVAALQLLQGPCSPEDAMSIGLQVADAIAEQASPHSSAIASGVVSVRSAGT
ncbi:MAG TPA: hypothetical protein VGJ14_09800 [Sporichthyaceae bacterium]